MKTMYEDSYDEAMDILGDTDVEEPSFIALTEMKCAKCGCSMLGLAGSNKPDSERICSKCSNK